MAERFTVVNVVLRVEQDGRIRDLELAGAFDEVRTQDQARAAAGQICALLGDVLCRRLQSNLRAAA